MQGEIIIEEGLNEINMAIYGVDTYNPLKTNSESVAELLSVIYDSLFDFDENLLPIPVLAEEVILTPDKLGVKIKLAKNVKWHSGIPFTADDVVYTINEIKNGGTLYSDNVKEIEIASVDAEGSLLLALREPVMNIEGLLSFPIIRNGSSAELDEKMDGTGAFYVAEQTAHDILLLPNKDKQSSVSAIRVQVLRSNTACLNAFEMREVDFVTSAVVDLGEKTPAGEISTHMYTSNQMTFLGFNCSLEKYIEPSLRLAVCNIINRENIIEKAVFDKATECRLPINPESSLYSISEGPELDIDGVMNKAGYTKNNGIYIDVNGAQVTISILVNIESVEKISAARLIINQLEKQGIKAELVEAEYEEYKRRISAGEYDTFVGEIKMRDNLDPSFLTSNGNMFRFSDSLVDEAVSEMKGSSTIDELKSKAADYERAFSLNPPFSPLYYRLRGVVYKKEISGITPPTFYNSLSGIEKLYFKAVS